jgi:hypothetical protein
MFFIFSVLGNEKMIGGNIVGGGSDKGEDENG